MHNQMLNTFYRKKLKFNNNINIEFQVIDWASYDDYDSDDDEEQDSSEEFEHPSSDDEKPVKIRNFNIKAYGVTERGNTVCIHIKKFKPYFFLKLPSNWGVRHFKAFISRLKMIVGNYNANMLCKAEIIHKKEFYGFTNNSLFKFAKFTFHNKSGFYSFQRKLSEKVIKIPKYGINHNFKNDLYESKIDPMLRFFHEKDICPCGWVKIPSKEYSINSPQKTRCQIDVTIHYDKIESIQKTKISPMVIASFDIECTSEDGTFPNPHRKADEVIQIGTTFHKYGEQKCFLKHIVTLKKCNPIPEENTVVESYSSEKEVLMAWAKFIEKIDPDIITGYNIWGFDWTFLHERSLCKFNNGSGNYSELFLSKLSRVIDKPAQLKEKELRSAALGDNTLKWIDMEGVVQIDLLKLIQKDHNLDSYKLDAVAHTFMGLNKVDLSPKQLFANYRDGSPEKIKEIAVYCIKDCELVNHLIMKLEVIANNIGMGNVCLVPFSYLFMRGQGIKIFSLVAQICREEDFLIKNIDKDSVDQSSYEGAIVFDPKPGVYFEPIAVMDYASLYPSSMISENISHDSIVSAKEFDLEDNLVKEEGNKEYDNLRDYNYSDIQYDVFKLVVENGKEDKKKVGYKVCRFAEHKNGDKALLPRTLKKLLKARKDTRKKIKYQTIIRNDEKECFGLLTEKEDHYEILDIDTHQFTKVDKSDIKSIKDTYNDFEKAVLDGLQLAYKVVCNSLYGQVGAATSSICYKELAASTTATGRKMVTLARDYTLDKFKGSKLVYGDSIVGDEPLLLQDKNGRITIKTIETLSDKWEEYENFKIKDTIESNRREKEKAFTDYKVWSNGKWNVIKKVIRHKNNKEIYRINTHTGIVETTEDHSLMNNNGDKLKPNHCIIGKTKLKHSFPTEFNNFDCIIKEQGVKNNNDNVNRMCKICNKLYNISFFYKRGRYNENREIICKLCIKNKNCKHNNIKFNNQLIERKNIYTKEYNISKEEAKVWGMFLGDGSCGYYKCKSGNKYSWAINNNNLESLKKYKRILEDIEPIKFKILNTLNSSGVYKLVSCESIKYMVNKYSIFYYKNKEKIIPDSILNSRLEIRKAFFSGYYDADGSKTGNNGLDKNIDFTTKNKITAQSLYYLAKSIGYDKLRINIVIKKKGIYYRISSTNKYRKDPTIIKKLYKISKKDNMYVYDLETENGDFNAGIGEITVFNTDSIFVSFVDYIKDKYKDKNITEKEMLKYTIEAGEEAGEYVTSKLKKPQNLEYEKVFWPFCIFSKKRYFGNKYEFSTEKYKQTSMGIVLKRRDNAPIVKDIYAGVIDIILNKKDIDSAKEYFKEEIAKLLKGEVDLSKLIISKTLRGFYVNPTQIAHKVLADRMGERDPGNKPAPSDRIPYCYIDESKLKCEICAKYVNPKNCKCIDCMKIYCKEHLHNHRNTCHKSCRFCRTTINIKQCPTCTALFCSKCMIQHKKKTDKFGRESYDKCKKRLTNKILQGDIIEYPPYVKENNIPIDYRYYLDHQIQKPVMQIFELVMKNPESIIESIIRKDNNRKSGSQEITKWFGIV